MSLLDLNPVSGVVDSVAGAVEGVAKVFVGDKSAQDQQEHEEVSSTLGEFAAEFQRPPQGWFDNIVNGLNRLPRPLMALGVMGMMAWCPISPDAFARAMAAYTLVPVWLASLFGVIVGFYFAARHLEQRLKFNGPSPEQITAYAQAKAMLEPAKPAPPPPAPMPDKEFKAAMDDPAPLSNQAIVEWNRRRAAAGK